jgi:hypothetical protein
MSKPEHKFFERNLDNDLKVLYDYLIKSQEKLLDGYFDDIPKEILQKYNKENGPTTQLGQYYNIFKFDNNEIKKLHNAIKETVQEASIYYGIDFNSQNYMLNGWYNVDYPTQLTSTVSPIKDSKHYHDHMGGEGAPVFHGYYCVNAEPSITYYKINNSINFENQNKNNRAIISETGHPHGRDDWYGDRLRITIAYDVCPASSGFGPHWVPLA